MSDHDELCRRAEVIAQELRSYGYVLERAGGESERTVTYADTIRGFMLLLLELASGEVEDGGGDELIPHAEEVLALAPQDRPREVDRICRDLSGRLNQITNFTQLYRRAESLVRELEHFGYRLELFDENIESFVTYIDFREGRALLVVTFIHDDEEGTSVSVRTWAGEGGAR